VEKPGGVVLYREVWGGGQSKGENGLFVQGISLCLGASPKPSPYILNADKQVEILATQLPE